MVAIIIVFIILLVISLVMFFVVSGKEKDCNSENKDSLVDDPAILFDNIVAPAEFNYSFSTTDTGYDEEII